MNSYVLYVFYVFYVVKKNYYSTINYSTCVYQTQSKQNLIFDRL
jgi:hypothetical protein